ncbi:MAG TPA: SLC13 family permease [Myxococcota bacterium]|nr:SLC13 family permease [Myxococcota bacterium]
MKVARLAVGVVAFAAVLGAPTPDGLSVEGQRCAAVAVLMAVWWLAGALPMAVTALVPLVAFPVLGIADVKAAASPFAHPLNFLMLGGFIMGHAIEEVGLHRRVTASLLFPAVRKRPRLIVLALMVAAAGLSGMVSNTATMVMMLPIAATLASRVAPGEAGRSAFALALAYACSIGGVSTLIGTPPNAVLAGLSPRPIAFGQWMLLGVPFVVVALPLAWMVVLKLAMPKMSGVGGAIEAGPWKRGEPAVLIVTLVALALWLTRRGLGPIPAWGLDLHDSWIAIGAALLLFLLPGDNRGRLLAWDRAERAIPWSVILLLGGGFSLAAGISSSGLTAWLAGFMAQLGELPLPVTVLGLCLGISFVTELTSNTATTQISLPLLAAGAEIAGVDPLLWMVPATISASCAFMMPVATAPNAIACEAGGVSAQMMARCGVILNIVIAFVAAGVVLLLGPLVFG